MPSQTPTFSQILDALVDTTQPLSAPVIYGLSGLDRAQLARLESAWPTFPTERRLDLLQRLNEASEANFELDFRAINHLALSDTDGDVRRHAIEGLWEDETPALMHKLVRIARQDPHLDVRTAAVCELGRFILLGEYETINPQDARLAQDTVLAIFEANEDDDLRRRALEALANCGREGIEDMIRELYDHRDLKMRISAVFAMGRSCDPVWTPEILREMTSPDPELRYEAARAAGYMELQEAVPHLARLLEETDDIEILEIAIWALGEIGGERARDILSQIIALAEANDDEEILAAAQEALDAASLAGNFLMFDFE